MEASYESWRDWIIKEAVEVGEVITDESMNDMIEQFKRSAFLWMNLAVRIKEC